ncbi:MAG: hypothetical protein HETSPECPRED_001910 [Heterodermia speciosa]|uniref:Uncharacterized protein n=1 Tax=Heterodermia speciosa TaxID=116794 RepID=A0A8H3PF34_9LECA|nr:MAG: hypothetical protein HETSPECPRED_001910 [Heterodermia speciosa]
MQSRIEAANRTDNLPLDQALYQMGLTLATSNAILDPRYAQVRGTETPRFWARETVRVNWNTLVLLNSQLKAAARRSQTTKKAKISSKKSLEPENAQSEEPATSSHTATVSTILESISSDRNLRAAHVSLVSSAPALLPDHYVLYKATAAVEMEDWISEDGDVSIEGLATFPGGDFNPNSLAYYWTLERATAQQYHGYASIRCPYAEIWLLEVQIPNAFISSLTVRELWFSRDWKEFIWYCRKLYQPPSKYDQFRKPGGADLIQGHICKSHSHTITKIKKDDIQDRMDANNVMVNPDGQKVSQWAFVQPESTLRLAREIRGKIHVEISPPAISIATTVNK